MFSAQRLSRAASLLLIASAAITQACSDSAMPPSSAIQAPEQSSNDASAPGTAPTAECAAPSASWIFCDDFESDRSASYFEIDNSAGKFARTPGAGWGGSVGMRARYTKGQNNAGHLSLAFGAVPDAYFRTVDAGVRKYREIYWRYFVRRETGWVGNGASALTRATTFAASNWSQAMLAVAASEVTDNGDVRLTSYSGTDAAGNLTTVRYNDDAHLRSLSSRLTSAPVDGQSTVGKWQCYEFHVKLNDAGQSNGVYEMFVNGQMSTTRSGLNWLGAYSAYGVNSLTLENYYSSGAPANNVRTIDNLVVATSPIGCGSTAPPPPPPAVATITVAIDSATLTTPDQARASATLLDASGNVISGSVTWSSSNTAVATVSSAGQITAVSAGIANIVATSGSTTGQASIRVVTAPPAVASVAVSFGATSIQVGSTTQGTAMVFDALGNVLTGRTLTWTSSNTSVAAVSATGLVTAIAPGSASVTVATGGKSAQATITVVPAAVASVSVSLGSSALTVGATTQAATTIRDASGNVLTGRTVTWSSSNTAAATVSASGLVTAVAAGSANIIATSGGVTGQATVSVTGSAPPPPSVLFSEGFEDTNMSARGWYDLSAAPPLSSTEHISGSTHSLQLAYTAGAITPGPGTAARHLFTPTNTVYLRYWVKYSSNWVGSGKPYHPHEFYILTTEDDEWAGPAYNYLTMYVEANFQNGVGTASLASQDARNIDATRVNQDLTNVTESRAVSGCNGNPDGTSGDCYQSGGTWYNDRAWRSAQPVFLATPGANYKNDWHKVEVFFQLNSIVNGKGQRDGVAQYWFDGQLVVDRRDLYLRTAIHPNMKFNQLIIGPYIGDGSPVAQTTWIDELSVQTARPANP